MTVAKIIRITASSPTGFQEALLEGINRANRTLKNLTGVKVVEEKAKIENGKIIEYRVTMEINFLLLE